VVTWSDAAGHLAYAALLLGQWLVTGRHRHGFALRVAGSLAWAGLGLALGMSSIVLWSLAFAAVDARAWWRW
jgi:hypothetical protein